MMCVFFFPLKLKGIPATLHTTPFMESIYLLEEETKRELSTLKESRCSNAQLGLTLNTTIQSSPENWGG